MAQISASTEELRGLDTKITAVFAAEIVELGKDAEANRSQLESLLDLSEGGQGGGGPRSGRIPPA